MPPALSSSVAQDEIERFSACAHEWWDPSGSFRMLHRLMPAREAYVCGQLQKHPHLKHHKKALQGLHILDIGCGGGLIAESLSRKGANVTGIDASKEAIRVAKEHAQQSGLSIDYMVQTAEGLAREDRKYDAIIALEIVEHVANLKLFLSAIERLLKPDGIVIFATMNQTKRSFLLGVVMAEYVMGWVPPGTHDWDRFVKPSHLAALLSAKGLTTTDITGLVFRPFSGTFELCKGKTAINYFLTAQKG